MARSAGSVNADVTVDASKAKKGVKEAKSDIQSFIKGLKGLAGIVGITLSVEFAVSKFRQFIGFALEVSSQFEIQRAAITAIIQGQERFLDNAGRQIPVEQARTQALLKTQEIISQINDQGMRPVLRTSREFQGSVTALLPVFRQFGIELDDSLGLMKKIADAAALASIPGDQMVNQTRQILASNITNESKLAKIVGLNNEIVNQAKIQGRLTEVLSQRFGVIANQVDLIETTFKAAQVELRNTIEIKIAEHFIEARDAVKELLVTLNEVAKSDAFAKLIDGASKLAALLAENAAIAAKMFEQRGLLINPLDLGAAATQARIGIEIDKASSKLKQLAATSKEAFETAFSSLAKQLADVEGRAAFIIEELGGKEATDILLSGFSRVGLAIGDAFGSEQADKVRRLVAELKQLGATQKALSGTLERGRLLRPTAGQPQTKIQEIEVRIKTEQLKGNTIEVKRLTGELETLKKTVDGIKTADVQAFDPSVIKFQSETLSRIEGALQRQERSQANIRSLELQRKGINAELANSIAQQEASVKSHVIRQRAVAAAEATIVRETENLASKSDVVVSSILSLSDAYHAAEVSLKAQTDSFDKQIADISVVTNLTAEEKAQQIGIVEAQKSQLDVTGKLRALKDSLAKGAFEEFKTAEGINKLESEFGKLLADESPHALQLLLLIQDIKNEETARLAVMQAQNVELEKQVRGRQLDLQMQRTQTTADFQTKQLELQQRVKKEGFVGFGAAQDAFELGQEQQKLDLEIVQLEQQKAIATQQTALAGRDVAAIQEQINTLSADATPELRQQLDLRLQDAQAQQGIVGIQQQRLANEIAIANATKAALPTILAEKQAAKFGTAVGQDFSNAISGAIQSAVDGDFDFRKFGKQLATSLLKTALQPFIDSMASAIGGLFKSLATQFGASLASAVLAVVGLLGILAFSKTQTTSEPANAGLGKAFETTGEPLRGVIAGRKSIPVAQIFSALSSALIPTNQILRQIAANTAGMKNGRQQSTTQTTDVNTTSLNAMATV